MTKYDWSNVPKEVKWIATDEDGTVCHYIKKPVIEGDCDYWTNITTSYFDDEVLTQSYQGNWQYSLEERPPKNDLPETVVKSLGEVA